MQTLHKTKSRIGKLPVVFATGLILASTLMSADVSQAASTCDHEGKIWVNKYFLHNNKWGQNESGASGWNCLWNNNNASPVSWGTSFSWTGNQNSVKAYPSCVLGWHWGTWSNNSGLPTRIWDNKNVNTGWNFSVTGNNRLNVSYDLWFHTMSNPTWQNNPSDEIMVWLYKVGNVSPAGSYQHDVSIAGTNWELWKGTVNTWNVYSFVRKSNTTSATMNLRDFIHYIVYSKNWMSNAKYLTSVQAGPEVFTTVGEGKVDTSSYYCNVQ